MQTYPASALKCFTVVLSHSMRLNMWSFPMLPLLLVEEKKLGLDSSGKKCVLK